MGDSQINIIINTLKRGTGDKDTKSALKDIGKSFQNATGLSLGYAGGISAAVAISKKLIDITKQSISDFTAQANAVEKLTILTGNRADEISRMKEVADDYKLSEESLTQALQAATRKGIDVNTESLARMSDEYLKLAPGLERAKYLTDNFGKSGTEMYKVMQLSGAVIRAKSAAVSESIVIDQQAIEMSNRYQKSVDDVNDAGLGLKNTLAKEVMPTLTSFNTVLSFTMEKLTGSPNTGGFMKGFLSSIGGGSGMLALKSLDLLAKKITEIKYLEDPSSATTIDWAAAQKLLGDAVSISNDEMAEEIELVSIKAGLTGSLQKAIDSYNTSLANLNGTQAENTAKQREAEDQLKKTTAQIIYQNVSANLDADTQLELARSLGLISEADYELTKKAQGLAQSYQEGIIPSTDALVQKSQELLNTNLSLQGLGDKTITYTIVTDYISNHPDSYVASTGSTLTNYSGGSSNSGGDGWEKGNYGGGKTERHKDADGSYSYRALGGFAQAGESLMVGEKGPEPFVPMTDGYIFPNNSLSGGPVTIIVNGAGSPEKVAELVVKKLNLQRLGR